MNQLNITLDDAHAVRLRRLAERMRTNEITLADALLASALDGADPDPRNATALLDGMPGAFERARLGLDQARAGLGAPLEEL